ncbi:MAG: glycosyltransferase family 4 protein [Elainella sp. Prado103]|nr:glycosyltransferase family 4 protein [Elainella sp. Prado103]
MDLRVLIVAEHASAQFGGEAALPLHYYRVLRRRGIPVWLVIHERTRPELETLFPDDRDRIFYIPDTIWHLFLFRLCHFLPDRISYFTTGFILRLITQLSQRQIIRRVVREQQITVIHQPMPVSPKEPSMIFGMGAPVVIGPMNGGMDYPPAFRQQHSRWVDLLVASGRRFANFMNWIMPGKRAAAMLLVANQRTRQALPQGVSANVIELVENGVDLSLWQNSTIAAQTIAAQTTASESPSANPLVTHFVFVGRLVDWKAVDLLLLAFKKAAAQAPISLTIIGDGKEREDLVRQAQALDLLATQLHQPGKIHFAGWLTQADCVQQLRRSDALVLPSLLECGGAVVLEAMALSLPVIATHWGGPADYLDPTCGILVEPSSPQALIAGLSEGLVQLAASSELRQAMGQRGREKVCQQFDWEVKVDRIMELYRQAMAEYATTETTATQPVAAIQP